MTDEPHVSTNKVQFHYIKSPSYREVACHGVFGGPTPQGLLWVSLFSERGPIPRIVEYSIEGKPGDVIEFSEATAAPTHIESRAGVIRHVEISTYLDHETAKKLHHWLGQQIATLESNK